MPNFISAIADVQPYLTALNSPLRRRWLPYAALLAGGSAFGLLAAETALRLTAPRIFPLSPTHRFDPQLSWVQKPGVSLRRRNESGQRIEVAGTGEGIRRPPRPYDSSRPTVLVVGDSFTAGTQVPFEEAWPAHLGSLLERRGRSVQAVNGGVDGYDLSQTYWMTRRLWNRFRPVHLVVAVFAGNDLKDYDTQAQARPPWRPPSVNDRLREHAYLFHLGRAAWKRWNGEWDWKADPPALPRYEPSSVPGFAALNPAQKRQIRDQFAAAELAPALSDPAMLRQRLASTTRMLDHFRQFARTRCASMTLVVVPTKQQVIPEQRQEWMALHALGAPEAGALQQGLRQWAESTGTPFLDARGALGGEDAASSYWPVDMHLSPAGHQRLATAAAPVVSGALAETSGCAGLS